MNANEHESYTGAVAKHIVYASEILGKPVEPWIAHAATNYYGAGDDSFARRDEITAILCALCREMTPEEQAKIIYDGRLAPARALAEWWDEHQAADARREREEREAEDAKRMRAVAYRILNDLPHEVRTALVAAIKAGAE